MKEFAAIPVQQPIGTFYLCALPYWLLEKIAMPDALTLLEAGEHLPSRYKLEGNQREETVERRKSIGNYINTVEATFPNTIILAVNVDKDGGTLSEDSPDRWSIVFDLKCNMYRILIPSEERTANIIDGQHRLRGFKHSGRPDNFDLPCAIFFDISTPEQASIFATININQKKVDRSLAFNLFAYNLDDEPATAWSPEKLAVFFTRRLSVDIESPLKGHIKVVARQGRLIYSEKDWHVSTAVFVDGISALISKNSHLDRDLLASHKLVERNRKEVLGNIADDSPLREMYLEGNDLLIYKLIINYFSAASAELLNDLDNRGFLTKTIGLQALLDFLKLIAPLAIAKKDITISFFAQFFSRLKGKNLNDERFSANGTGRQKFRNLLIYCNQNATPSKMKISDEEILFFDDLLSQATV
jgi:DNA phosphorothioation-associated DGQHR protein 1